MFPILNLVVHLRTFFKARETLLERFPFEISLENYYHTYYAGHILFRNIKGDSFLDLFYIRVELLSVTGQKTNCKFIIMHWEYPLINAIHNPMALRVNA